MLARKITRGKWAPTSYLKPGAIRADGVTGDLGTIKDTLSLWRCENDSEDLDRVFLALATGSKVRDFDRIDIVLLDEQECRSAGLAEERTDGDTAVLDLKRRHVDLVYLDLDKLGALARLVASRVNSEKCQRRTRAVVKRLVTDAMLEGRVEWNLLNEALRKKL